MKTLKTTGKSKLLTDDRSSQDTQAKIKQWLETVVIPGTGGLRGFEDITLPDLIDMEEAGIPLENRFLARFLEGQKILREIVVHEESKGRQRADTERKHRTQRTGDMLRFFSQPIIDSKQCFLTNTKLMTSQVVLPLTLVGIDDMQAALLETLRELIKENQVDQMKKVLVEVGKRFNEGLKDVLPSILGKNEGDVPKVHSFVNVDVGPEKLTLSNVVSDGVEVNDSEDVEEVTVQSVKFATDRPYNLVELDMLLGSIYIRGKMDKGPKDHSFIVHERVAVFVAMDSYDNPDAKAPTGFIKTDKSITLDYGNGTLREMFLYAKNFETGEVKFNFPDTTTCATAGIFVKPVCQERRKVLNLSIKIRPPHDTTAKKCENRLNDTTRRGRLVNRLLEIAQAGQRDGRVTIPWAEAKVANGESRTVGDIGNGTILLGPDGEVKVTDLKKHEKAMHNLVEIKLQGVGKSLTVSHDHPIFYINGQGQPGVLTAWEVAAAFLQRGEDAVTYSLSGHDGVKEAILRNIVEAKQFPAHVELREVHFEPGKTAWVDLGQGLIEVLGEHEDADQPTPTALAEPTDARPRGKRGQGDSKRAIRDAQRTDQAASPNPEAAGMPAGS